MNILIKVIVFLTLTLSVFASQATEWEYKKWKVALMDDDLLRYSTNGQLAYGNLFGFTKKKSNCSYNNLWLTIYTTKKGTEQLKGKSGILEVEVDEKTFKIETKIKNVFPFTTSSNIVLFSDFLANDNFINLLKNGKKITFTIASPTDVVEGFDVPYEIFSLSGFSANYVKATEACKDSSVLNIAANIKKEIVLPIKYPVNNIIKKEKECIPLNTDTQIQHLSKFYEEYDNEYTLWNNYLFYGDGGDGQDKYPNIKVRNICNPFDVKDVTEIDNSDGQVNKLIHQNNLLYVFYWDYFKIFDVSDIKNIKLLSKFPLDDFSGDAAVAENKIYALVNKKLIVINTSDKNNPLIELEKELSYGSNEIAFDSEYLYITGSTNLSILDKKTYSLISNYTFPYAMDSIIIKNKILYIKFWNNNVVVKNMKNGRNVSGLLILDATDPNQLKVIEERIGKFFHMQEYQDYIFMSNNKILNIKNPKKTRVINTKAFKKLKGCVTSKIIIPGRDEFVSIDIQSQREKGYSQDLLYNEHGLIYEGILYESNPANTENFKLYKSTKKNDETYVSLTLDTGVAFTSNKKVGVEISCLPYSTDKWLLECPL